MMLRSLFTVLFCMCLFLLPTFASTTYDLPSRITRSAHTDTVEAISNGRTIWLRTISQRMYREIRLPESMYEEFVDLTASDIEVSASGRYLFIAVNGAEGLYRYDIQSGVWESVRPLESSRSVSCIMRSYDGTIYAGCGGYPVNNAGSNHTGLFRSTDDGATWTTIQVILDNGTLPGIADVAINDQGLLMFIGRRKSGTAPQGIYGQLLNGDWKYAGSSLGTAIVGCGSSFFCSESNRVALFVPGDTAISRKFIFLPDRVTSMDRLGGDTLLVMRTNADSGFARLDRIVDSTVINTSPNLSFVTGYDRPYAWVSTIEPDSIYISGTGHWSYSLATNSHNPFRMETSRPYVSELLGCANFTYANVSQHGWYKLGPGEERIAVSIELGRQLDLCSASATTKYIDRVYAFRNDVIYVVTSSSVDSIATLPSSRRVTDVAATHDERRVYASASDGIFLFDRINGEWTQVTSSGWPTYTSDGTERFLGVDAIFIVDTILYAWFRGDAIPVDHWDEGGLYRLQGDAWSRVPSNVPYRATSLMKRSVMGSSGVFYAVERTISGSTVTQGIMKLVNGGNDLIVELDEEYTLPYVTTVFADDAYVGWATSYGNIYSWVTDTPRKAIALESLLHESNVMAGGVLVPTLDWGVLLLDHEDVISSVPNDVSRTDSKISVYRSSEDTWTIELPACSSRQHIYREFDLLGCLLNTTSVLTEQGHGQIHRVNRHATCPVFIQLQSSNGSCSHTAVIMP